MIVVYLNLHHSSVMVTNFTSEGDKSNPGPEHFAIKKVVQASYHQDDFIRYERDSAGKQCTANAYFANISS